MEPDTPITPTDDQQPADAAATTESTTEASTDTAPSAVDLIAAAVGAEPAKPEAPAPVAATPDPAAPPVELTPEQKAKAEDERLEAEAKAFGITKPDTTAKFKELSRGAARAKELEPEVTRLETELAELRETAQRQNEPFDYMEQHGVTGDQFGQAVAVLSHINSGDPVRLQRAYEALGEQMAAIGAKLGLEAPGYDPLAAHADLQAKVANMDLSREDALEIAHGRQLRTAATTHSAQQGTQTAQQQELAAVTRELTALETRLRATDPQFAQKWALLGPTLVPTLSRLPLRERASAFEQAYAAFQLPAAPAAPATTRPDPANPGRPAMGAGAKAPTNSAEAIMLSLGVG